MTHKHIATANPLPSSILHNSTEVRRQYSRAAGKQIAKMFRSWGRKARAATPELQPMPQGEH